jgi:hypothetical protein
MNFLWMKICKYRNKWIYNVKQYREPDPLGNDKYKWNKKPKATTEETIEFDTDEHTAQHLHNLMFTISAK